MAFDELPKIDRAALNSDQSAIELQKILNQNASFILRVDVPDLGCDFDVELVKDTSGASNWRFPLQLKSIENPALIEDGKFISYSFKTSRLGYLLRRHPSFGLIVLYDVQTSLLYYDYADEVYLRLMEERAGDDWKANEMVNIHIPATNILNPFTAILLHKKFLSRFEQGALMQASQGAKYGLPAINLEPKVGFDFNNLDDVKQALKKWGMSLLLQLELQIVFNLIGRLPASDIIADREVCLIALIAYSEAGKFADAIYYIERIRKRFELTHYEKYTVGFAELKCQLSLGNISPSQYIDKAREMLPSLDGTNSLTLKINILYFEMSLIKALESMPLYLGEDTQKLFFEIEAADIEHPLKQYLKLWNAENMDRWISHFRSEGFAEMDLRRAIGKPLSSNERAEKAMSLVKAHSLFYVFLNDIDKKAKETNDLLLQAHVIKLLLRFELSFEIDKLSHELEFSAENKVLSHKVKLAQHAFQVFMENSYFKDAYMVLLYQIDLITVLRHVYDQAQYDDLSGLMNLKANMEKEFEFDGELSIPSLLKRKTDQKTDNRRPMEFLVGLNDRQLGTLAEMMIRSGKYPNGQNEHIIGEMKSYQLFHERCGDAGIAVEQMQVPDLWAYASPVRFILKNNRTNLISTPETDMDKLLKSWGF